MTVLIAYRIWHSGRKVRRYRASGLTNSHWPVIETVVQSAAIYSAALVALLGCYVANSFAQYTVLDAMTPLIVRPQSSVGCVIGFLSLTYETSRASFSHSLLFVLVSGTR